MNYYNEFDHKAAAWLRELIRAGLIPDGHVDTRSILDVQPGDLAGYTQCHFFAGIGGWSLALQLAGWPADKPVWTGSCPCQPFSSAGKQLGAADERHLWPVFFDLIRQCRPPIVFGEQVASAAVVGHSDKNKSMQSVRGRETLFRILQELKRGAAGNMQGLCKDGGASAEAEQAQDGKGRLQKMEGRETRLCSCKRGEAQSQELWDTLRPLGREHSGKDRQGGLRSDRDTLRPIDSPLLERTLTGPNHTQSGIHHGEYPSGLICPECHGELLGVTEDCGSVEGYSWVEERSLGQIIGFNREEAPRTLEECWLDGISADLEQEGYACGATVLGAHSVGAPHIRQRLYWVANAATPRLTGAGEAAGNRKRSDQDPQWGLGINEPSGSGPDCWLAQSEGQGRPGMESELQAGIGQRSWAGGDSPVGGLAHTNSKQDLAPNTGGLHAEPASGGTAGGLVNAFQSRLEGLPGYGDHRDQPGRLDQEPDGPATTASGSGHWSAHDLLHCTDGKTRRIEPGSFPLAHGVPGRVGLLRGYGNAILPPLASEFIKATGLT